jgi:hypothetical protein
MTVSRTGLPRFVAYNLANGRMVMTGASARQILNHIRDHLWPSVDGSSIEIFDRGAGGADAQAADLSLEEAREHYGTTYRGPDGHSLTPIPLDPMR